MEYNARIRSGLCDKKGPVLVENRSNNCFASSLLFALMAVSTSTDEMREAWPEPEDVTPQARPFFELVRDLNESSATAGITGGEVRACFRR